jgi:transposase InsO family protein
MSEIRLAFVHQVDTLHASVTDACETFGISRKTGYKWLRRYRQPPGLPLVDHSRRPRSSPNCTEKAIEDLVIEVRKHFGWGPRKIHAYLTDRNVPLPSIRTVENILKRRGCIAAPAPSPAELLCFERSLPNQLWQCDHKGPLEVGRRKIHPFTVLDDHSRYLLALRPCLDLTMPTAFAVLWDAFGEFGLPESILCDNAFATTFQVPRTVSWFDAQLIRLGIHPLHGRPYHPQTQGKVERIHRTFERELWPYVRRGSVEHFDEDANRWRTEVYNLLRPHEALGDRPPLSRFRPSPRKRPATIPEVQYPPGSIVRKVSTSGDVRWKNFRILAGRGLVGQLVRIEDRDHELALFYAAKEIRCLAHNQLQGDTML